MGDMGDYWNDHKDYVKARKLERIQEFRDYWPEITQRITGFRKGSNHHILLEVSWQKRHVDLWPSTGKWSLDGRKTVTGTPKTFINWLDNRSGAHARR